MDRRTIMVAALAALAMLNGIAFALMGLDKRRARQGRRRVPERALFLAAGCFGALGGVLGMRVFRHKTRHWSFRTFFPALLLAQVLLLAAGAYQLMG